jgi:hypothetical protein
METKAYYISIYKLGGVTAALPDEETAIELARLTAPSVEVLLTVDSEPHFTHIDRQSAVLARLISSGVTKFDEPLTSEIADAKRSRNTQTGLFLVIDGEMDIPQQTLGDRIDGCEFGIILGEGGKADIRGKVESLVQSVLVSLTLSFKSFGFTKIGEAIYLNEAGSTKPIYLFDLAGRPAKLTVSRMLASVDIETARASTSKLMSDKNLSRPVGLLKTSLDTTTDELQGFIAAWSALEIFTNATFKSTYENGWRKMLEQGIATSAKPALERFAEVMTDKYRLADKFLIIASMLDSTAAPADDIVFRQLKKFRDGLLHALDMPSTLPTIDAQHLLLKYLKLHLVRTPES